VAGSSDVTVSRSSIQFGIELDPGTSGTALINDEVTNAPVNGTGTNPAIWATDAPGTRIVNDTITPACSRGVDLEGASTGSVIENDVINTSVGEGQSGTCGEPDAGITVAPSSVSGTTSDYNVVFNNGNGLYSWGGSTYADPASHVHLQLRGRHAQRRYGGEHGPARLPVGRQPLREHQRERRLCRQFVQRPERAGRLQPRRRLHADDRDPDLGHPQGDRRPDNHARAAELRHHTGGFVDRGAYEFQDPIALAALVLKPAAGRAPLDVQISTGVTTARSAASAVSRPAAACPRCC